MDPHQPQTVPTPSPAPLSPLSCSKRPRCRRRASLVPPLRRPSPLPPLPGGLPRPRHVCVGTPSGTGTPPVDRIPPWLTSQRTGRAVPWGNPPWRRPPAKTSSRSPRPPRRQPSPRSRRGVTGFAPRHAPAAWGRPVRPRNTPGLGGDRDRVARRHPPGPGYGPHPPGPPAASLGAGATLAVVMAGAPPAGGQDAHTLMGTLAHARRLARVAGLLPVRVPDLSAVRVLASASRLRVQRSLSRLPAAWARLPVAHARVTPSPTRGSFARAVPARTPASSLQASVQVLLRAGT